MPPAGVQGAEPLGGGQGAKPPEAPSVFGILKVFLTCHNCGYYDEIPNTIVLCFKLHVSLKTVICTLAFVSVFTNYNRSLIRSRIRTCRFFLLWLKTWEIQISALFHLYLQVVSNSRLVELLKTFYAPLILMMLISTKSKPTSTAPVSPTYKLRYSCITQLRGQA